MSFTRPLLILDLDETLIRAVKVPLDYRAAFCCGPYFVYERPFLHEFIVTCARYYKLAVWTSATAEYSQCIVHNIMGDHAIDFLWSRDRCIKRRDPETQEYYWLKDLKKVKRSGYDLAQVLIVDDTRKKVERNYGNLVLVNEFTGDPQDRELKLLADYLKRIAGVANFRAIEKRKWRGSNTDL